MNGIEKLYEDMLDHQHRDVESAWEDAKLSVLAETRMKIIVNCYCGVIADTLTDLSLKCFVPTPRLHRIFCEELLLKCMEIDRPDNLWDRLSAILTDGDEDEEEEEEEEEDEITAIINKVLKELHNR